MLIAFMGSAGSGKTTIARTVYQKFDETKVDYIHHVSWLPSATTNIFMKIGWAIYFWTHVNIPIFRAYLGFAWRNRAQWPKFKDRMYMSYIAPVFVYNLKQIESGKHDILVYDTDIIVPHADAFEESRAVNFFSKVILPKVGNILIVSVDTPHDVSVARWQKREQQNLSATRQQELITGREKRKQQTELLLTALSSVPGVQILYLDGTTDPEQNATVVYEMMKQLLSQSETQPEMQ